MRETSTESYELGEGPASVLLVHGFSGSPWDLHPVAEHLARDGLRCVVPRLPGHGSTAAELGRYGAADWMASLHDVLDRLAAEGRKVFLAGFSMGGCACIRLAAERPGDVTALALLAPALGFRGSARLYRELFRLPLLPRLVPMVDKGPIDVADPVMRRQAPYLPTLPTAAARGLDTMVREARRALPHVRAPSIVLWGAKDAVVPRAAAEWAAARIGSGPARLAVFPRSAHQLALDLDREAVAGEIGRFFGHFRAPRAAASNEG